tara:strand:+ start:269 stop:496 length:228 start_codon:yes stop_codon:yes gene_type:complete
MQQTQFKIGGAKTKLLKLLILDLLLHGKNKSKHVVTLSSPNYFLLNLLNILFKDKYKGHISAEIKELKIYLNHHL